VIVFEEEALADLERILEFNAGRDPATALEHLQRIREGVSILGGHPEIGRTVAGSPLRELVISHGSSGYIALYEYARVQNVVRVVAIRHQREAGYRGK
jgi:plasmid stabilization system protein ParE